MAFCSTFKKTFYCAVLIGFIFTLVFAAKPVLADPPFITDSPVTLNYEQWGIYFYSFANKSNDATNIQLPAMELDWGASSNCQIEFILPFTMNLEAGGANTYGLGDIQTGFLYRMVTETAKRPQIGIEPIINLPSGSEERDLGNGNVLAQLPIWIEKNWGQWTAYSGGGYFLNREPGTRDYPFGGGVIQRNVTQNLALGLEIYTQGPINYTDSHAYTELDFGETYQVNKNFSVLASLGHTIVGEEHLISYIGFFYVF